MAEFDDRPELLLMARAYYARNPVAFINDWLDTYDPRRETMKWLPFLMFPKQEQFVNFLLGCIRDDENGLIEKCRDMGATWICCAFTIWAWLFIPDVAIGWGSRKQEMVDRIGDSSSIFEKLRQLIDRLPKCFLPNGFDRGKHATYMKLINPENGATVIGESGDNIGRGGRTKMYFKDESAHYERPELVEAALGDNTNVQIDISSVNGLGNVFHKKREAGVDWPAIEPGKTRVFVFDYSDHPAKDKAWYERRRQKAEDEGLLHLFAQEVERNYAAAVQNAIIPFEYINAARDAHLKFPGMLDGPNIGGFDIADEGADTNAIADIKGVVLRVTEEWGARDPGVSARRAIAYFQKFPDAIVFYDNISYGTNVKSEYNRARDELFERRRAGEHVPDMPEFIGWNAGATVQRPFERLVPGDDETPLNKDFFGNMKAQAWWSLRNRFLKTWQVITQGATYPLDELISLSTRNPLIRKLEKELTQPTMTHNGRMQMIIDKKPDGMSSPNLADAVVMGYFPPDVSSVPFMIGTASNGR